MSFLYDMLCPILIRSRQFKKLQELPRVPGNDHGIRSFFPYREAGVKEAILKLKTKRDLTIAIFFAKILAEDIAARTYPEQTIGVIGIPARRERLRRYGFAQCELLAILVTYFLKKHTISAIHIKALSVKDIGKQAMQKSKAGRMTNLANAFSIRKRIRELPETIILIDDVTTTGATLLTAEATIKNYRAVTVHCFAVAH